LRSATTVLLNGKLCLEKNGIFRSDF
jgi:hypothetical protein